MATTLCDRKNAAVKFPAKKFTAHKWITYTSTLTRNTIVKCVSMIVKKTLAKRDSTKKNC